jgi:hypothetical protein
MELSILLFIVKVALLVYITVTMISPTPVLLEVFEYPMVRSLTLLAAVAIAMYDVPLAIMICLTLLVSVVSLQGGVAALIKNQPLQIGSSSSMLTSPPESREKEHTHDGEALQSPRAPLLSTQPVYDDQEADAAKAFNRDMSLYASVECGDDLESIYIQREKLAHQLDDEIKKITFVSASQLTASQTNVI